MLYNPSSLFLKTKLSPDVREKHQEKPPFLVHKANRISCLVLTPENLTTKNCLWVGILASTNVKRLPVMDSGNMSYTYKGDYSCGYSSGFSSDSLSQKFYTQNLETYLGGNH